MQKNLRWAVLLGNHVESRHRKHASAAKYANYLRMVGYTEVRVERRKAPQRVPELVPVLGPVRGVTLQGWGSSAGYVDTTGTPSRTLPLHAFGDAIAATKSSIPFD